MEQAAQAAPVDPEDLVVVEEQVIEEVLEVDPLDLVEMEDLVDQEDLVVVAEQPGLVVSVALLELLDPPEHPEMEVLVQYILNGL